MVLCIGVILILLSLTYSSNAMIKIKFARYIHMFAILMYLYVIQHMHSL